jgi:hypothetical protein
MLKASLKLPLRERATTMSKTKAIMVPKTTRQGWRAARRGQT